MAILYFDWDSANIAHIAEHNVTPEEVEQVLLGDPLDLNFDPDTNGEERWTYIGETNRGRILLVVMTQRDEKMRVVTSFEAERQDKLLYLETKAGQSDGFEGS
jgi:uncharacterized DUF497 family protein